jgi:plastocyanin
MRNLTPVAAVLFFAAALLGQGARAADLTVQVRDMAGRPVADAVVMVRVPGAPAPTAASFSWPMAMSQRHIAFDPHLLIVPLGSDVVFPNFDTVRHHVYSFSPAKRFELKLYGREETRKIRFDKPGPVALGCNIHDEMSGFIYVVETPFAARTNAAGAAVLRGLPRGAATLAVWHPYLKAPAGKIEQRISVAQDALQAVSVNLIPEPGR